MSHSIRVLLVDDHRMFAEALEMLLAGCEGIEVIGSVPSAEEAFRRCLDDPPDVVVIDVDLPGMNGVDATRHLGRICPSARVLVVSGDPSPEIATAAFHAGARGFVPKTESAKRLLEDIRRVGDGDILVAVKAGSRRRPPVPRVSRAARASELTPRELEVLEHLAMGLSTGEISERLFISQLTVQTHVRNILTKLGLHSKLQAVTMALQRGMIRIPAS